VVLYEFPTKIPKKPHEEQSSVSKAMYADYQYNCSHILYLKPPSSPKRSLSRREGCI